MLLATAGNLLVGGSSLAASQCFGTPSHGRLEQAVRLPLGGANFSAYSTVAAAAGRTYLHSTVADIVLASYARLATALPSTKFVYGETGLAAGGPFKPHKTHQNGLSVDFFVPVRDAAGDSAILPASVLNHFGYDIEFDAKGQYQQYHIDFPALAEHLYQLTLAAAARGVTISNVIIDRQFLPQLFATPRGPYLREQLPFMVGKPWVRHDEHFHLDFSLKCKP